jgi:hypothetical protein
MVAGLLSGSFLLPRSLSISFRLIEDWFDAGRPDGTPAPATQTPSAKTQPPTGRPSASAARQPVPTRQLPTATTGGVRAGAPAARPGYGALGPRADLNAGRQPTAPTKPAPAARPAIGRAPTPRPIAPPRITAEDIGQ